MLIRKAKIQDAESIAKVHIDTWRTTYKGIVPDEKLDNMSLERDIEMQRKFISNEEVTTLVCEIHGQVIGFACCGERRDGPEKFKGELYGLYISKEYQGRGIGNKMVEEVVKELKSREYSSMLLWALEENSSCKFYEKLGGQKVGEQYLEYAGKKVRAAAYGWEQI